MRVGMVGLGRMGASMAERLRRAGHHVAGYDRDPGLSDAGSLAELVSTLGEGPRTVWTMVPAGEATEATILELRGLLDHTDVVVDGANSHFRDSIRRADMLAERGVGFVDVGVSGGVWGLEHGYCLMVGGDEAHVEHIRPLLHALAEPDGVAHLGPVGAGHFTKMVHNGIEYGLMQAYAEGYELLASADIDVDPQAAVKVWRHGSVVRSWLLDLLDLALDDDPALAGVQGWVDDSGTGRWTVQEAVRLGVPVPAITAALYARFASRQDDSPAMKALAVLRKQFGGHPLKGP